MEEMLDDTLEGLDEDAELEEEAEEEVERVLFEITDGKLGVAGAGKELPVRSEVFPALHYCVLMRIIEPQRRRGGSSQRSGDGTYAGSVKQPANWIIDALRANVLAYLHQPHDYFCFCLHLSHIPFCCFILFILSKPSPTLLSVHPTGIICCPLVRSSVSPGARVQLRYLYICAVLSVVESASTQGRSPAVSLVGVCVTPRVCCCCLNWRICRQKERKCTSPLEVAESLAEHLHRESTP